MKYTIQVKQLSPSDKTYRATLLDFPDEPPLDRQTVDTAIHHANERLKELVPETSEVEFQIIIYGVATIVPKAPPRSPEPPPGSTRPYYRGL